MGECAREMHVWESSNVGERGYRAVAVRCEVCHVGYLIEWTAMQGGALRVDYNVFSADGNIDIGQAVNMWAITMCEGLINDMRADGVTVIRGVPVFGGPRPPALQKHTQFGRLPQGD